MKKQSIYPSLPKNLTVPQLRKEIRRRLKISEQLGLIKKPMGHSALIIYLVFQTKNPTAL
jgi:hypothetical protein